MNEKGPAATRLPARDFDGRESTANGRTFPISSIPAGAGDTKEGQFVRLEEGYGRDGTRCPILILQAPDGSEVGIWLWHKVLRTAIAELRPRNAELVHVEYLGRRKSESSGHTYHAYRVDAPEREAPDPDWSSLASDEPQPAETGETETARPGEGIPF